MTRETLIASIQKGGMEVRVVEVPNLTGYRFDAVDESSLPLAVECALLQTRKGSGEINRLMR